MRGPVPEAVLKQRMTGTNSIHVVQVYEIAFGLCHQELTVERNFDVSE
jgi:hypothetical protein